MPTVKDVATRAGVSVGTVSKVLSKDPTVKPALRARVQEAVAALGYRPNLAARALRTNEIDVIGLVVPDISNPFFAQLAKQIEARAAQHGQIVMLANSDDDRKTEARQVETLLDQSPRGLIVVGATLDERPSIVTEVPIVSVDRRYGESKLISTNHELASALVADHLFDLGHRRIAYISGPQTTDVGRLRQKGFCDRIQALSREADAITLDVVEGHFDYASGEALARQILSGPQGSLPTAIAAASDQQAIGALRAARDLNIPVPDSLSIVGFDDIDLAQLVVPRLTSVSQRVDQIATLAVNAIMCARDVEIADIHVPADLVTRGSTAICQSRGTE